MWLTDDGNRWGPADQTASSLGPGVAPLPTEVQRSGMTVEIAAPEDFPQAAADVLVGEMLSAFTDVGHLGLCLAGGSTPRPVYDRLVTIASSRVDGFPWHAVHVWFGDERWVDSTDPASNYRMARESLIDPAGIDHRQVHRVRVGDDEPDVVAASYQATLPQRFDVLILGIGEDGHTASLFPHSRALWEKERLILPTRSPVPPHTRLTITPPVIERAERIVMLAAGADKAAAVAAALEGKVAIEGCPARLARHGTWILDSAAASLLRSG